MKVHPAELWTVILIALALVLLMCFTGCAPDCANGSVIHKFDHWQTHRPEGWWDSHYQYRTCTACGWAAAT